MIKFICSRCKYEWGGWAKTIPVRCSKCKSPYWNISPDTAKQAKNKTRRATQTAIKSGTLVKQSCEVCGSADSQIHHPDYSKPLEIKWLCGKHHKEIHGKRDLNPGKWQRPAGPLHPCGWCHKPMTTSHLREHLAHCPARPTSSPH